MVHRLSSSDPTEYDCTTCGRCCYSDEPEYAFLHPEDLEAFDRAGLNDHTMESSRGRRTGGRIPEFYMRMEKGRCCALDVLPGNKYSCSIYEDRPLLCRIFEPGGSECLKARERPTQEVQPKPQRPS